MYKIREFSKFATVSPRMLRYYDNIGLLKPAKIDNSTGYRYYSAYQIPILNKIITLRDAGFNVEEIARLLQYTNDKDIIKELENKQIEIKNNITLEKKKISRINEIISSFGKEHFFMDYKVEIKEVPACKVVSLRRVIENYSKEIDLWAILGDYAMTNQLQPFGEPFAIYHDGEYREKNVDVEVAMPVFELEKSDGEITFREVASVPIMATILYKGPYDKIDSAFFSLAKWIEDSSYEPCGKVRQVSIKGEWNESNPDNYLTEIQMPIRKQ